MYRKQVYDMKWGKLMLYKKYVKRVEKLNSAQMYSMKRCSEFNLET